MTPDIATPDLLGYAAAGLVLITFLAQSMTMLRALAIASNVLFIAYALVAGLPPVLVLHALLLPLNAWRLWQASRTPVRAFERVEPQLVLRAPVLASFRAGAAPVAQLAHPARLEENPMVR
ncbi:MAG TPA: hypothetical protein VLJ62_14695 [Burkholderiaceae bacterium]|nr:hypothetical protein [Burkholderiaceae bacterium]